MFQISTGMNASRPSAIATYGTGVLRPAVTSLITQKASKREQGVVLGLTQSLTSIAQILAPVLSGLLIDRGWLAAWAMFPAAIAFCGFLVSSHATSMHTAVVRD